MNVIILETHNVDEVEWGVSLTDHNPTSENYIGCKDYESANKLKNLLAKLTGLGEEAVPECSIELLILKFKTNAK